MTDAIIKRERFGHRHTEREHHLETETQKEVSCMKIEKYTGGLLPQPREGMGLPEAGRGKERATLSSLGGSRTLSEPVLDFLSSEL